MELRDFVGAALVQIAQGANDASDALAEVGAIVNPAVQPGSTGASRDNSHFATLATGTPVFLVSFDVAVTVSDSGEASGSVKAGILEVFSAKAGAKSATTNETVSRIQFNVPLALRPDTATAKELAEGNRKATEAFKGRR